LIRVDAALLALLPFAWLLANHYPPWVSAWQEGAAIALLLAGVVALSRAAKLPGVWALAGTLVALSVVGQGFAGIVIFAGDVWMVVLYLAAFILAVAAGATLVDETGHHATTPRLEALCTSLLIAALASVGIALAQWAGTQNLGIFGADLAPGARPYGNLAQPNHLCTAAFIGLGAALVLYEARRIGTAVLAAASLLLIFGMVASGSRTAWLQLLVMAFLVLSLRTRTGSRTGTWHLSLLLGAYALGWWLWPWLNEASAAGGARSLAEQAQAGVRLPLWQAMLQAIAQRPWFGYGWQQMVMAQEAVAIDGPLLQRHFEHAHNLILDLMVWAGLPVGLGITALMATALGRLWWRATDPRVLGLLVAVGGLGAHAMVEFPAEYAYFLLPAGLLIGAAHRLVGDTGLELPRQGLRAAAAVFLAALVVTALDYIKAEEAYRMLRLESARIGTASIQSPAPDLMVLTQLQAFQRFARTEARAGMTEDQLQFSRDVSRRFAYPPAQFRHALAAGLNDQPTEATQLLATLCRMQPRARCAEAIEGWRAAQAQHPQLMRIPPPDLP
jgi:hypothetical protein